MLSKSSAIKRDVLSRFTIAVQPFRIIGPDGIVNKLTVFDRYFIEGTTEQVQLDLIAAGMHPDYRLEPRQDYDQASVDQQRCEEATQEELHSRCVNLARKLGDCFDFDQTVAYMVESMRYVIDNKSEIENSIKARMV